MEISKYPCLSGVPKMDKDANIELTPEEDFLVLHLI